MIFVFKCTFGRYLRNFQIHILWIHTHAKHTDGVRAYATKSKLYVYQIGDNIFLN